MDGSGARQGRLWNRGAADWASWQQHGAEASWSAVLAELALPAGARLLDVGCGGGGFARLAHRAGLRVHGVDAAPAMIEQARILLPQGGFLVGELERLPLRDGSLDAVTLFNSVQFAADQLRAVTEAVRVLRPGGRLAVMVWGPDERCDARAYRSALSELMPPGKAPRRGSLSGDGVLRGLLRRAGLDAGEPVPVRCTWAYPDERTMLRALLSTGPATVALAHAGEGRVRERLRTVCAPFRRADGSFRLDNEFQHIVCTV